MKNKSWKFISGMICGLSLFIIAATQYNHIDTTYDGLNKFMQGVYADALYSINGSVKVNLSEIATNSTAVMLTGNQTIAGTKTFSSAIAGSVTGNAGTVTVANEATDTTCFPLFATDATGSLAPKTNTGLMYNSNTGLLQIKGTPGNNIFQLLNSANNTAFIIDNSNLRAKFYASSLTDATIGFNSGTAGSFGLGYFPSATVPKVSLIGGGFAGVVVDHLGNVGIGISNQTARLHVPAGTATAGTAPLKLTSGTLLTTPEAGAIEYDGTSFYLTNGTPTRTAIGTLSNPMDAAGDMIVGGVSGAPAKLVKGTDGQSLVMVSGAPAWSTPAGGGDVVAPATTTENKIPFWSSVAKTLSDGWAAATTATANTLVLRDAQANITANLFYDKDGLVGGGDSLPDQTGNNGKYLTTNGTAASWAAVAGAALATQNYTQDFTINSALSGYTISNYGATTDIKGTFASDLPDGFSCRVVNEAGGVGIDAYTKLYLKLNNNNTDSSASPMTGTSTDMTYTNSAGEYKFGYAGVFNGSTSTIIYDTNAGLNLGSGNFTISMWIKFDVVNSPNVFFGTEYVAGSKSFIAYHSGSGNTVYFQTSQDGTADGLAADFIWTPSANTWYHIMFIRNSADLKFYVNGTQTGNTFNISTSTIFFNDNKLAIGAWVGSESDYHLDGNIDEFLFEKGIARAVSARYPQTAEYYFTSIMTLSPPSGSKLPGTSAINRNLVSSAFGDSLGVYKTADNFIGISVFPAVANWVDTAQP